MPRTFKPGAVKLKRVKRPQLDVVWNQPTCDGSHHRAAGRAIASHVSPEHETWNACVDLVNGGDSKRGTLDTEDIHKSSRSNKKSSTNFSRKPRKSSKKKYVDGKASEAGRLADEKPKGDFNFSLCVMEMLDPLLDEQAEREEEQEGELTKVSPRRDMPA